MQDQKKATGAVSAPEVTIQKNNPQSVGASDRSVNYAVLIPTMADAMRAAGLSPAKSIDLVPDGKLHRYRIDGDKAGSLNGWYVQHSTPILAGAFGSWKTSETHTWREAGSQSTMTPEEHAAMRQHMQGVQAARVAEQAQVHAEARAKAERLWRTARPATNDHAYLVRKRIGAIGIRRLRDMLVVPVRDASGNLHTLQFIGPDGQKRFLTGGRIAGGYFAMGRPTDSVLVCEGYATGATLFKAMGGAVAVAVAFNCGNLPAVARALRGKFPALRMVLAADNDSGTAGNPGLRWANEAAQAVGGFVAVPRFEGARNV